MTNKWSKELKANVHEYFLKHCITPESLIDLTTLIEWALEEKEIEMKEHK